MFTTLIVQPIFNLLVMIYAIIPGHNFGMAIIIFTILVRLLMWPLVKKQLNHTKAMRALQPEIKKIKAAAKGDRKKETTMVMELYKEREINPFSTLGILIVQLPILFGLYKGLTRVIDHPDELFTFTYPFVQHLPWMEQLKSGAAQFDNTLFGIVDLTRAALEKGGGIYWGAMILVLGSAIAQFFQSKQLLPNDKDARSLRAILKDATTGKSSDQQEVSAAMGRLTVFFIPALIFLFTVRLASALSLYWLVSALVALIQQTIVLREDEETMEKLANGKPGKKSVDDIIEAEVVSTKPKQRKPKTSANRKKRRKR